MTPHGRSHEAMSGDMLDYLVDQHSIDLPKDVIDDVRHLISASHVENPVTPRSGANGTHARDVMGGSIEMSGLCATFCFLTTLGTAAFCRHWEREEVPY